MTQNGRTLFVVDAARNRRRRVSFRRFCSQRFCRLPLALGEPFISFLILESSRNGEYALGNSGLHTFVNGLSPESHRYRRRFVRAGIVVLAINEDGDGDHSRLAARCEFNQAEGARAAIDFLPATALRG